MNIEVFVMTRICNCYITYYNTIINTFLYYSNL